LIYGRAELLSEDAEAGSVEVVAYVAGKTKAGININSLTKRITFDTC
jgi:hypothetical protein